MKLFQVNMIKHILKWKRQKTGPVFAIYDVETLFPTYRYALIERNNYNFSGNVLSFICDNIGNFVKIARTLAKSLHYHVCTGGSRKK